MSAATRPRTIEALYATLDRFRTEESRAAALAFRPRPSDVLITTYPKSGTTWLQQLVHVLRGGDMGFEEICAVVPWLESAVDMGIDVEGEQPGSLRAFKTHLPWEEVPQGGRHIYVVRDPRDVLVSFYRFFEGWMFEAGAIDLDTFARRFFMAGSASGRWWGHVGSWWPQRRREDVLLLHYEELRADLPRAVRRVAGFIGVSDPVAIEAAVERSSFAFMAARPSQFDDHLLRAARDAAMGLPPAAETSKVRAGRVGDHAALLSEALRAELDAIWAQEIGATLGFADYEEMRRAGAGEVF